MDSGRETQEIPILETRYCEACDSEVRLPSGLHCTERCSSCGIPICWNCACFSPNSQWLCINCSTQYSGRNDAAALTAETPSTPQHAV